MTAVASFSCPCGARDEVLEPAPETVNCWGCKRPLAMRRWSPGYTLPTRNARKATDAERLRIGQPSKPPSAAPPKPPKKAAAVERWKPNPGHLPNDAKGRRVFVRLVNGSESHGDPNPMSQPGWAADGPNRLTWTKRGLPFDVEFYCVVK